MKCDTENALCISSGLAVAANGDVHVARAIVFCECRKSDNGKRREVDEKRIENPCNFACVGKIKNHTAGIERDQFTQYDLLLTGLQGTHTHICTK